MQLSKRITTGEAARRIGVSPSYVVRLIHDQRLPAEWTALGFLLDPEDVETFRRAREERRRQRETDDGGASSSDKQAHRNALAYPTM